MKLNKNVIYYITNDLENRTGYFLNCETNVMLKFDEIAVDYFLKILNAKSKDSVKEYLLYFEGCDLFEQDI